MATETKINDIASQLSTASRLVVSTDFFWIYMANGSQVKIPAEFARAYLTAGIKPVINSNGHWEIGGEDLGIVAEGKTPQFRGGTMGIEVSYDDGKTWTLAVAYTDMNPDLTALTEAYNKVIQGEAGRVKAENTRSSNEAARVKAENTRVSAENTRNSNETTRKTQESTRVSAEITRNANETTRKSNETARQDAESTRNTNEIIRNNNETARKTAETKRQQDTSAAITNSQTQTAIAKELNEHPVKMGDNGNWWQWNIKTHAYEDTGIVARGGAMYPTFKHVGNKLYIVDYGSNVSERVVKKGNKLVFRI